MEASKQITHYNIIEMAYGFYSIPSIMPGLDITFYQLTGL